MNRTRPAHGNRASGALCITVALVAAIAFCYRDLFSLGFVDVDTYSLIATGRIDTLEHLGAVWTEPLMQGQMPNAVFWRPLTSMSWGLDALLWGDRAIGFHLTDLLLHLVTCWLLHRLLLGMGGPTTAAQTPTAADAGATRDVAESRRQRVAAVATLLFAVHPIGYEVVPAIARRADSWLALFGLAVLCCVQRAIAGKPGRGVMFSCAFAGMLAKVSAVLYLPLALALALLSSASWRSAFICRPIAIAIALGLVIRWIVLDGTIGGYSEGRELSLIGVTARSLETLAGTMLIPGQLEWLSVLPIALSIAAVGSLFALAAWIAIAHRADARTQSTRLVARFAISAIAICFVIYPAAHTVAAPRGMYLLAAFASALSAVWLVEASDVLRRRNECGWAAPRIALGAVAILVMLSSGHAAWSGHAIASWHVNAERIARVLDATRDAIRSLDSGTLLLINYPTYVEPRRPLERPVLLEHSVQGWLDLHVRDGAFDAVGLSHATIFDESREPLRHTDVHYSPSPPMLDIEVGDGMSVTTHPWDTTHRVQKLWHPSRAEWRLGGLTIHLDPTAATKQDPTRPVVCLVWNGETVQSHSAYVAWRTPRAN